MAQPRFIHLRVHTEHSLLEAQDGLNIDGAHVPPGHARAARLARAALRGERPPFARSYSSARSAAVRLRAFRRWCLDHAPSISPHVQQFGIRGDRVVIARPAAGLRPVDFRFPEPPLPAESA